MRYQEGSGQRGVLVSYRNVNIYVNYLWIFIHWSFGVYIFIEGLFIFWYWYYVYIFCIFMWVCLMVNFSVVQLVIKGSSGIKAVSLWMRVDGACTHGALEVKNIAVCHPCLMVSSLVTSATWASWQAEYIITSIACFGGWMMWLHADRGMENRLFFLEMHVWKIFKISTLFSKFQLFLELCNEKNSSSTFSYPSPSLL